MRMQQHEEERRWWEDQCLRREEQNNDVLRTLLWERQDNQVQPQQQTHHQHAYSEERYAKELANERIRLLHSLEQSDDVTKYLENIESFMTDVTIPNREWKHIVHSKLPVGIRQALTDLTTDVAIPYSEYTEVLITNMGYSWKQEGAKFHAKFPPVWRELKVREFFSTLRCVCLSIIPDNPSDQTVAYLMRSWIWETLLEENRKLLADKDLCTVKSLTSACQGLAEAQHDIFFPSGGRGRQQPDSNPDGKMMGNRGGRWMVILVTCAVKRVIRATPVQSRVVVRLGKTMCVLPVAWQVTSGETALS